MIEEILDRLERIDHKEYCGGFEFADSATFEEMGRCFDERKKLANYAKELQQENKQLKEIINKVKEYCKREIGNIIANYDYVDTKDLENILEILGDKENE